MHQPATHAKDFWQLLFHGALGASVFFLTQRLVISNLRQTRNLSVSVLSLKGIFLSFLYPSPLFCQILSQPSLLFLSPYLFHLSLLLFIYFLLQPALLLLIYVPFSRNIMLKPDSHRSNSFPSSTNYVKVPQSKAFNVKVFKNTVRML